MDKTDAKAAMEELTMILIYLSDLQNRFANKDDKYAWKGYDFNVLNELDGKDYIRQGSHRSKSLYITKEGEEKAKELGVKPMATWVAGALGGVDPTIMGVGPVASTKKVLAKTGMSIDDFDLIEANEAFSAQSIAVGRDLNFDLSKLNVNGGAIALGHPVGASGCRILVTLLHEMEKRDAKTGLATLCIGGGMGCSTIVKRD